MKICGDCVWYQLSAQAFSDYCQLSCMVRPYFGKACDDFAHYQAGTVIVWDEESL